MKCNAWMHVFLLSILLPVAQFSLADDGPSDVLATTQAMEPGRRICARRCAASELEAHRSAARKYLLRSITEHREYAWHVYLLEDGSFAYSHPDVGLPGSDEGKTPPIFGPTRPVSTGHTHWNGELRFSGLDREWVKGNRRNLYLVNRTGEMRILSRHHAMSTTRSRRGASNTSNASYPGRILNATINVPTLLTGE